MVDRADKYELAFYKDGREYKWDIAVPIEMLVDLEEFFSVQCYSKNDDCSPIDLYPKNKHGIEILKSKASTYYVHNQPMTGSEYNAIKSIADRNCLVVEFKYKSKDQRLSVGLLFKGTPIFR